MVDSYCRRPLKVRTRTISSMGMRMWRAPGARDAGGPSVAPTQCTQRPKLTDRRESYPSTPQNAPHRTAQVTASENVAPTAEPSNTGVSYICMCVYISTHLQRPTERRYI